MAHTYVGTDDAEVRRMASAPLKTYLASYVRQTAANRAADAATAKLTEEQTAMLADFAFERYLSWGSLLGSPATAPRCSPIWPSWASTRSPASSTSASDATTYWPGCTGWPN